VPNKNFVNHIVECIVIVLYSEIKRFCCFT